MFKASLLYTIEYYKDAVSLQRISWLIHKIFYIALQNNTAQFSQYLEEIKVFDKACLIFISATMLIRIKFAATCSF